MCFCPVALAIQGALGKDWEVWRVTEQFADLMYWPKKVCKSTTFPMPVSEFIRCFDNNETVEPFEFELDLSPWNLS